jgi:tetratricopeptide (TPR) repeat protein
LLGLGFALHRQVGFWSDNVTLWTHTLEITERNYTAEDNLATALLAEGKVEDAVPHLRRAILFRPDDAMATLNLATYEQMRGNYQAAIDGYARVPRLTKDASFVTNAGINSGYAHLSLKQYDGAKRDFEAVLGLQPANSAAYRGLGLAAQRGGDIAQAIQNYERSVEILPTAAGYLLLAQALEIGGQKETARAAQNRAARMSADLSDDMAMVKQLLAE